MRLPRPASPATGAGASVAAVAGNLTLNIALHPIYGYRILALGTAAAALLNFAVLYGWFHRALCAIPHLALARYLVRVALAALIMGAAVLACARWLIAALGTDGMTARLVGALAPVVVGALVYALVCRVLGVEELGQFTARLRKRRRRG